MNMATVHSINIERSHDTLRQKVIDDWRPIKPSPKTKWWYSTFHNITAIVGAGVLSLPYAMSKLGWGPGIAVLLLSWVITLYSLWQMVQMHERKDGKRLNRYHELGQDIFGQRLGLVIVVPQQLIVQIGVNIVYMVTAGGALQNFLLIVSGDHPWGRKLELRHCVLIFTAFPLIISNILPNYHNISWVSFPAAIMSVTYSLIIFGVCLHKGMLNDKSPDYRNHSDSVTKTFDILSALGVIAFAYAAHNIVLEIQATIPSHPGKPSKGPMWRGALVAYFVVACCYIPIAVTGFWAFGNGAKDNILTNLECMEVPIAIANLLVFIHLIGGYQIYAMPIFDMMETVILKKLLSSAPTEQYADSEQTYDREEDGSSDEKPLLFRVYSVATNFLYNVSRVAEDEQNGSRLPPPKYFLLCRFGARSLYVVLTATVATQWPYFVSLMAFFGGLAMAPNSYFLPNIMWLIKEKRTKRKIITHNYIINSICIAIGIALMILASVGSLWQLSKGKSNYKNYAINTTMCNNTSI